MSVIDANSNKHVFTFDLAGRTTREVRPNGEAILYAYDEAGNLVTRTSPKGDQRSCAYDPVNRRTQETQTPAGSSTVSQTVVYNYDERNLLIGYTQTGDTQSSAGYIYDAKGQKIQETMTYGNGAGAFSKAIQYDYYPNGLKKFFTYPDGTVISYGYTSNNQLNSATTPDGNTIQYTHYVWNLPTQVQMPGVVRNVTLDPLQRPLEIKAQAIGTGSVDAPNGTVVMDFRYTYDSAGNIIQRVTEDGEYNYIYDKLDRLTGATPPASVQASPSNQSGLPVEQYSYDAVHNRISSAHQPGPWTYNADNQLLSYGQNTQRQTYTYDANGNTIKQVTGDANTPSNTRTFLYNAAERLTEVDDNGAATSLYQYDPLGRRIKKQANGQTVWYQYADEGVVAEFESNGTLNRTYGWKPEGILSTDPLWGADVHATEWTVYYFQNDHLGTSQRISEATGNVVWSAISEAFGKTNVSPGSYIENSLRLSGQRSDNETGIYNNYFRDYDKNTGSYIQRDPIGLIGGINGYSYVTANPISARDPAGLVVWKGTIEMNFVDIMGGRLGPLSGGFHIGFFTLWSPCVRGLKWRVKVTETGAGFSPSLKNIFKRASFSLSTITLDDGDPMSVNPYVFNGTFTEVGYNVAIWSPISDVTLGRSIGSASGKAFNDSLLGAQILTGTSVVTDAVPIRCDPCEKD